LLDQLAELDCSAHVGGGPLDGRGAVADEKPRWTSSPGKLARVLGVVRSRCSPMREGGHRDSSHVPSLPTWAVASSVACRSCRSRALCCYDRRARFEVWLAGGSAPRGCQRLAGSALVADHAHQRSACLISSLSS